MMRWVWVFCLGLVSAAGLSGQAVAADLPARDSDAIPARAPAIVAPIPAWLWEVRGGVAGHEIGGPNEGGTYNINGEVIYGKQYQSSEPLIYAWIPRLHIGGSWNTGGKTSFAYAGFTWTFDVLDWAFVEATFGGGIHNGATGAADVPGFNALGCSPLFRESAAVGFRVTPQWSVMATIEHMSNAALCVRNRGITAAGVKAGYRF